MRIRGSETDLQEGMIPLLKTGELMEMERVIEDDLKDQETLVLKARGEKAFEVAMMMRMRLYLVLPMLKTEVMVRISQMKHSQEGCERFQ